MSLKISSSLLMILLLISCGADINVRKPDPSNNSDVETVVLPSSEQNDIITRSDEVNLEIEDLDVVSCENGKERFFFHFNTISEPSTMFGDQTTLEYTTKVIYGAYNKGISTGTASFTYLAKADDDSNSYIIIDEMIEENVYNLTFAICPVTEARYNYGGEPEEVIKFGPNDSVENIIDSYVVHTEYGHEYNWNSYSTASLYKPNNSEEKTGKLWGQFRIQFRTKYNGKIDLRSIMPTRFDSFEFEYTSPYGNGGY